MEEKKKKTFRQLMRSLHRDIGFLMIGITLIYALSGIVLVYRDTNFLKRERQIEKQLDPNLETDQLGQALRMRMFKVEKTEGDIVYFGNGTYNKSTGLAKYSVTSLPAFLNKINGLHKTTSRGKTHWFTTVFGVLLIFLAISSFWMFKAGSKSFKRGLLFSAIGLLAAVIMLLL